jgi:hypothetical protein
VPVRKGQKTGTLCRLGSTGLGCEHCGDEQEEGGQGVHGIGVYEDMRTLSFIRKL